MVVHRSSLVLTLFLLHLLSTLPQRHMLSVTLPSMGLLQLELPRLCFLLQMELLSALRQLKPVRRRLSRWMSTGMRSHHRTPSPLWLSKLSSKPLKLRQSWRAFKLSLHQPGSWEPLFPKLMVFTLQLQFRSRRPLNAVSSEESLETFSVDSASPDHLLLDLMHHRLTQLCRRPLLLPLQPLLTLEP